MYRNRVYDVKGGSYAEASITEVVVVEERNAACRQDASLRNKGLNARLRLRAAAAVDTRGVYDVHITCERLFEAGGRSYLLQEGLLMRQIEEAILEFMLDAIKKDHGVWPEIILLINAREAAKVNICIQSKS